ncbi:hypothetical protein FISHEDRAFT_58823 [Fistulina hepatica ATCC 64428]|uniref:Uncharacterized protein n=1 Tax=Fistulina hepatica ATCC 64428 TaxID=1128425 RepID=A0A0D7AF60_9AGAR|nr:hypothetical protein FISHEDRAFT_58823 [Fistulina hepatica ATCC 64428]
MPASVDSGSQPSTDPEVIIGNEQEAADTFNVGERGHLDKLFDTIKALTGRIVVPCHAAFIGASNKLSNALVYLTPSKWKHLLSNAVCGMMSTGANAAAANASFSSGLAEVASGLCGLGAALVQGTIQAYVNQSLAQAVNHNSLRSRFRVIASCVEASVRAGELLDNTMSEISSESWNRDAQVQLLIMQRNQ